MKIELFGFLYDLLYKTQEIIMQAHTILEESYQEGCHGKKYGAGAWYENENLRTSPKSEREDWFSTAIERYNLDPDVKALTYNHNTNSVYLHSKLDPTKWRNINHATFRKKPSNRHENHSFVIYHR